MQCGDCLQNHRMGRQLWSHLASPPLQQGHPEQSAQAHVQVTCEDLQEDCTISLGSTTHTAQNHFLVFRGNLLCLNLCLLRLVLALQSPVLPSLYPPFRYLYIFSRSPLNLLFSRLQSQLPQPLLIKEMFQALHHLHGPSLGPLQYVRVFDVGELRTGHGTGGFTSVK